MKSKIIQLSLLHDTLPNSFRDDGCRIRGRVGKKPQFTPIILSGLFEMSRKSTLI